MSYGSLSQSARMSGGRYERIGGKSIRARAANILPLRPQPDGDSKRSSIKQVASGRFGVTSGIWSTRMRSDQDRPGCQTR
ncbi:MAG: glutamate synthase-related protein [Phascolarctobacterium faecium]